MAEQFKNVLWMTEELLEISPEYVEPARENIAAFLESAGEPELLHKIVDPELCLESLEEKLSSIHAQQPFTAAIDLTRGTLSGRLTDISKEIPVWKDFSMSRTRQATQLDLPTSGHIISHNIEEIRAVLENCDTSNMLVLDDTSFSGTTSIVVENLIRRALPERTIDFTHGFLILNNGDLGPNPGAKHRIEGVGSVTVGGLEMNTPRDDGWHFFDMVKQDNLPEHLATVIDLMKTVDQPNGDELAKAFVTDQSKLQLLFPNMLTLETLTAKQKLGHFVSTRALNGDLHVRNPQLLPNIAGQGHILHPKEWKFGEQETLQHLQNLSYILEEGKISA